MGTVSEEEAKTIIRALDNIDTEGTKCSSNKVVSFVGIKDDYNRYSDRRLTYDKHAIQLIPFTVKITSDVLSDNISDILHSSYIDASRI